VPHNLKDKVFTHFTADNIDINDSTLDGKNNVHATQMVAWQRGIGNGLQLDKLLPSSSSIYLEHIMVIQCMPSTVKQAYQLFRSGHLV
jgi:hypothetical protein